MKIEMELRGYSQKTIKNYILHVSTFSKFHTKSPEILGEEEIREFLHHCITVRKLSEVCNLKISETQKGATVAYTSKLKFESRISSIVGVTPIVKDGNVNSVFLAISSLQPVGEASSIIREFYVYFYALAIVLIIILSFFYTNMISKPLKKLNKTALKMSHLDFTEKCNITTEDEIGSLANTLNFLSDNLSSSLTELKDANEKLTEDIEKEKQLEKMRKEIFQWSFSIVGALIFTLTMRSYVIAEADVDGISMMPTLNNNDKIFVEKLSLLLKSFKKGQIIIFDSGNAKDDIYVKRVIAVEGDEIEIIKNKVFLNGEQLKEPYLKDDTNTAPGTYLTENKKIKIQKGYIFVLGDNRSVSYDSRYLGPININSVKGHVIFRTLPLNTIKSF